MPQTSLKNFLDNIIDYAGMFPPASLDLKSAFYNYLDYTSNSPYSWMLSRFILNVSKLGELDKLIQSESINIPIPLSFSVLGTSSVHSSEFLDSVENDVEIITAFKNKYLEKININVFEARLPNDMFSIKGDGVIDNILNLTSEKIEKINSKPINIFFEALPNENLDALIDAISKHRSSGGLSGYKLRTGGTEASAFPAPQKIAAAIINCVSAEIPMKFTAGLHHPIRHYNESVKTRMNGFINVFTAGIFNLCLNMSEDILAEILEDENPEHFRFMDGSMMWKEFAVLSSRISEVREKYLISFGSCSFEEPVDDLKKLNIL